MNKSTLIRKTDRAIEHDNTIKRLHELSDELSNSTPAQVVDILLQHVRDIVLVTDPEHETIYSVSASLADALHVSNATLCGRKIEQFVHPADVGNFRAAQTTRWYRHNGGYLCIEWSAPILAQECFYNFGKVLNHSL